VQAMIRGLYHGSIGIPQGQTRGGQAMVVVAYVSVAGGVGIAAAKLASGVVARLPCTSRRS
jgi:hypothetical protein